MTKRNPANNGKGAGQPARLPGFSSAGRPVRTPFTVITRGCDMLRIANVLKVGGVAVLLAFLLFTGCAGGGGGGGAPPVFGPAIQPGTAPPATVGVPYNLSFRWTANTVLPPFFWNLLGSMPQGMQFDPVNGRIYGTPTTPGTVSFTLVVRDSNNPQREEQQAYTLVVNPPPTTPLIILPPPPTLPKAKIGIPYFQEIHATGGLPPYTCSVSGYLPPGINLDPSNCTLSGTGTLTGAFTFTLFVYDSQRPPAQVSAVYTLNVIDPLQILTTTMPTGKVGEAYLPNGPAPPFHLLAKGGVPCAPPGPLYVWAFESGYRPPGLSFNPDGTVTGTPTTAGSYDFLVRVTDCDNPVETTTRNVSIQIVGSFNVTTQALPECKKDIAYSAEIDVTGGVPPYSWSLDGQLPVGLSFDSTTGHLTGIPSTTGAFPIVVTVTDSNPSPPNTAVFSGTLTCIDPVQITTATLPDGVIGVPYNTQMEAKGGVPSCPPAPGPQSYLWSLVNGFLPTGLTINANGTITGNPTASGTFDFLVSASDCFPNRPGETTTRNLRITIAAPLSITSPATLPAATVGVPYFFQLTASGGIAPYIWTADSGTMPPGLTLSSSGLISGTPSIGGTFKLNVRVTDSAIPAQTATQDPILVVSQFGVVQTTVQEGEQAVTYSTNQAGNPMQFQLLGGTPKYCWFLSSGTLPPTIAAATTFGVPQASNLFTMTSGAAIPLVAADVGTWNFRLEFRDDGNGNGIPCEANGQDRNFTQDYTLVVVPPPAVSTLVLDDAYVTVPYSQKLEVKGGIGPYTWTIIGGSLPPDITLNTDGTLAGTPSIANTTGYNINVQVKDSNNQTATQILTLRVLQDIVLCVDGQNGDDATGDGTTARPFKTLTRALSYTSANNTNASGTLPRIGAIRVAGTSFGTPLLYNENIALDAAPAVQTDVDLLGGYTGFCQSRGGVPNAIIKGVANVGPTLTLNNLTRSTLIELLEIQGNNAPGAQSVAIDNNSSPTIARNYIRGGNATGANAATVGILNQGIRTTPLIIENEITGGTGAASTFGIFNTGPIQPEIRDNRIDGGNPSGGGVTTSAGIKDNSGANPLIYDNTRVGAFDGVPGIGITGGTGTNAYGIWIDPASGDIARNIINCEGSPTTAVCAGIYVGGLVGGGSSATIRSNSINDLATSGINAIGASTRGVYLDGGSTATMYGNNLVYGGEGTNTSYGVIAENPGTVVNIGDPADAPGGRNAINGGGCVLLATTDSFGVKTYTGATANINFNTIYGGCGTGTSIGVGADPSMANIHGNTINGNLPAVQLPAVQSQLSIGVFFDNSTGFITDNAINGGNGIQCIAKQLIGPNMPSPEAGNTYTCGGQNSFGLWVENCPVGNGFVIQNHDGQPVPGHDGIIYGGDPTGPPPTSSTGLKLKNCPAEVRFNVIDGGSGQTATGLDVDPSFPNVHNNTIRGSKAATTTTEARGAWYHISSGGTLGGSAALANDITGAVVTSPANPTTSIGLLIDDNSVPAVQNNFIKAGQGGITTGVFMTNGADPVLNGNSIDGGISGGDCRGAFSDSAGWIGAGRAINNTILAGTCLSGISYGMRLSAGSPAIGGPGAGNIIMASPGLFGRGILVEGTANPDILDNPTIDGGGGTNDTIGIYGTTASWTGAVKGNNISGGSCVFCTSYGIRLTDGTPTIGGPLATDNNVIDGGNAEVTRGISVEGVANPTIRGNNASITGGTATATTSFGILWNSPGGATISNNKALGGNSCNAAGCESVGIVVSNGTPLITGNVLIKAGTAGKTFGVLVTGAGNPGLTFNLSIDGGTSNGAGVNTGARGVAGNTASWVGAVTSNTISGGGCLFACGTGSGGFELSNGAPVVSGNTITAGTYANRYGSLFFPGTTIATFTGNSSTGSAGTGYDIYDQRPPASGFINGAGTVMTSPVNPAYGPPGARAICSTWVLNPPLPTEILGDTAPPFDSKFPPDSVGPFFSPGAVFAPAPGPPAFASLAPGPYLLIANPGNCIRF